MELWNSNFLDQKPKRLWIEAVTRWIKEGQTKKSLNDDIMHLRWLDPHLKELRLEEISREVIDDLIEKRYGSGVQPATVNRMLEVIRAILRKSQREWDWLDKLPVVRMQKVENKRIRWLTKDEAQKLILCLPSHLSSLVQFSLATGLRKTNVTQLKWNEVDLERRHALIHPDQAKTKKAIPVPLNLAAMEVLEHQLGKHSEYVFTYAGNPIIQCNTKAWRKRLIKGGIKNFRWHDLRHTWASWHVQNGTSLQELQQLGGWASYEMVLRYAHLSSEHLKEAGERINVTFSLHTQNHLSEVTERSL